MEVKIIRISVEMYCFACKIQSCSPSVFPVRWKYDPYRNCNKNANARTSHCMLIIIIIIIIIITLMLMHIKNIILTEQQQTKP